MDNNEIYTLVPYEEKEDIERVDIKELITKLWFKRKFLILCVGFFILLGLFVAFTAPVSYTANCTVVPQTGSKSLSGGSLGGIASMMGVNIGSSMSNETLSPYVYPQIINSVPFCKEIMETSIVVERSNGEPITLYEYYTDKQYSGTNVLGVVKKYTVGLPGMLISVLRPSERLSVSAVTDTITGNIIKLSKVERDVIEIIQKSIQFQSNDQEGYVSLGYSFSEAQATADIAQNIYTTLEKYVKNFKTQKQLDNLMFIEESYERTKKDFFLKQAALAEFQDSNRNLNSAQAQATERSMRSEYEVAYTVYNELAVQLEKAKISVNESTPVLTVIDPVVIPNKKSAPKKALILIVFSFVGFIVSITWVLAKPFLVELISGLKEENIKE